MSARTKAPFRADHVGSLLRPRELLAARADNAAGRITAQELRDIEDAAIRNVVKLQEDIGLQGVTDGEYRRIDWFMDFKYGIGGVKKLDKVVKVPFERDGGTVDFEFVAYRVAEKLRLERCIFGAALAALGCNYLQMDDTSLAFLNDPKRRAALGIDAESQHLRYIQLFNDALAGRPAGMTVCTHLCRGNFRSGWMAEGGYEHVAEALFNELAVDGFFLEYDDARSGGFEPLRFVPKGKMVVLGLVTTKTPALESKDALKRRIDEAAKYVPLEQICLSPQCGFASTAEGNVLSIDDQIAKLRLVVETAREVWG